ncbi:putative RNA-binding protein 15B [Prionailurus viverrinus]|uniref:putative RNA-binding protein 15B n=1 Tax=Prionailurus viverrinus TaxID=61388 RepID=UPI001FF3FC89|nr:putative RNA-binding protein 15B [Prionailurus viverrinus]
MDVARGTVFSSPREPGLALPPFPELPRLPSSPGEARPPHTGPGWHLAGAADTAGGGDSRGAGAAGPRVASPSRSRTFSPEVPLLGSGGAGRGAESGVPGRSGGRSSATWPPPPPPLRPGPRAPLLRRVTMDPTIPEAPESVCLLAEATQPPHCQRSASHHEYSEAAVIEDSGGKNKNHPLQHSPFRGIT